jgi:hypothetical protein
MRQILGTLAMALALCTGCVAEGESPLSTIQQASGTVCDLFPAPGGQCDLLCQPPAGWVTSCPTPGLRCDPGPNTPTCGPDNSCQLLQNGGTWVQTGAEDITTILCTIVNLG